MRPLFPIRSWLAAVLVLALSACLDETVGTDPGPSPGGAPTITPRTAWIEVGSRATFSVSPTESFFLRVEQAAVASVEGADVVGLTAGVTDVEAWVRNGRDRARLTVVPPVATRHPVLVHEGLTDVSLLGLYTADPSTSFSVGPLGTIIVTRDGGQTWSRMRSNTTADLVGVWGSSATNVFAVGAGGLILHYDGSIWRQFVRVTDEVLLEVWGLDSTHVYAVGPNSAFRFDGTSWTAMPGAGGYELWAIWGSDPDHLFASGQNGVILRYDGVQWSPMPSPTPYVLFGLWGTSPTNVYAAGIRGTVLHFDGEAWSKVPVPTGADFFALSGSSATNIVAAGNEGAVLIYNGSAWTMAPQRATNENLRAIAFDATGVTRIAGWSGTVIELGVQGWKAETTAPILLGAALGSDGRLVAVGAGGKAIRWSGTQSEPLAPPTTQDLYAIARLVDGTFLVVGDSGSALHFDGTNWSVETSGSNKLLRSIWADSSDGSAVYVVGADGLILHRSAGGTWSPMASPTTRFLRHVFGLGPDQVFAVGDTGTVLRFEGGGWSEMPPITESRLRGVWGTSADHLFAVGENGVALRFDGRRWYPLESPTTLEIRAVLGGGPTDIYIVGLGGLVYRFNGSEWSPVGPLSQSILLSLAPGPDGSLVAVGSNQTLLRLDR